MEYPDTETVLAESGQQTDPQVSGTQENVTDQVDVAKTAESQPGQQPVQAAQEQWDGSKFALKFRGKDIIPESRDKLLNWAQLGYTYSGKLNDISEREKALNGRYESVKQYEQLAESFKSNPRLRQQIMDMYYQAQTNGTESQGQSQLPPEYAEQLTTMQQRLDQYEQARADESLNKELGDLQSKYPNYDWKNPDENGVTLAQHLIKQAYDLGGVPLETAFRHAMWDHAQELAKAEALKANAQAKQTQSIKGKTSMPQQGKAPGQRPVDVTKLSYDEIAQAALSNAGR